MALVAGAATVAEQVLETMAIAFGVDLPKVFRVAASREAIVACMKPSVSGICPGVSQYVMLTGSRSVLDWLTK